MARINLRSLQALSEYSNAELKLLGSVSPAREYETGDVLFGYEDAVKIINVTSDSELIEIRAIPRRQDIVAKESVFLNLDIAQSTIGAVADTSIAR